MYVIFVICALDPFYRLPFFIFSCVFMQYNTNNLIHSFLSAFLSFILHIHFTKYGIKYSSKLQKLNIPQINTKAGEQPNKKKK